MLGWKKHKLESRLPGEISITIIPITGIFQARILEWVAISFSRVSSQPRDQTRVSHIAGRLLTIWATGSLENGVKNNSLYPYNGLPPWQKNLPAVWEMQTLGFSLSVRKIPWRRKWQPTPVVLPGKSHRQRSLAGPSPWGLKRVRHNLAKLNNNPNNGIPLSDKEEGTTDIRNNTHESKKLHWVKAHTL